MNSFDSIVGGHLNLLVSDAIRGDSQQIILETCASLHRVKGISQRLFLLRNGGEYCPSWQSLGATVIQASGNEDSKAMQLIANEVHRSPVPVLYTHLIGTDHLKSLWKLGVNTIPIVHNPTTALLDELPSYNCPEVPFILSASDTVSCELKKAGCEKPLVTIRHEIRRRSSREELRQYRKEIRDRYGIDDGVLLIGMIGEFEAQKAYTRAARILCEIQGFCRAKLMIVGGWTGAGRIAYEAFCQAAINLGVIADVFAVGSVGHVEPYLAAFDVLLNTSIFESLSISLLEAVKTGCPVVAANVGGNSEVLPPTAALVTDPSDTQAYVDSISAVITQRERYISAPEADPLLVPRLWSSLVKFGISSSRGNSIGSAVGTLFVTNDLHIGGPQRSIVNLLCHLSTVRKAFLGLLGEMSANALQAALVRANVQILRADTASDSLARAEQIALWADTLNVKNICFWNVHPEVKLALAKILCLRNVRLIDVSPGPMYFEELDSTAHFQRRISLNTEQYFRRLDYFVALYADGIPAVTLCPDPLKVRIIPLGVPEPPNVLPALPPEQTTALSQYDPQFAIGTCSRIIPQKRIEFLLEMMFELSARLPQASLTIVGGPDVGTVSYMNSLMALVRRNNLTNIFFPGRHDDMSPFLRGFRVFVLTGDKQGCPNASLEAMAMKLPVVTNCTGGMAEQIEDGVNGFLVSDPSEMAYWVETLLLNSRVRELIGRAAKRAVCDRFSMQTMVERYCELLA
jgi:glycosyltransferase involved in cell wall biosynthesis